MPKTDIVIVNWNAGDQLRECIDSILQYERDDTLGQIVVVDNASRDGSADYARSHEKVLLVEPGRNLGFGTACNLGAEQGHSEYVLFLNPDTRFLQPTLHKVQAFMEAPENSSVAVCGIKLIGEDGHLAKHCSRQPGPLDLFWLSSGIQRVVPRLIPPLEMHDFDHEHEASVGHVMGAFYYIRRELFERLRGFDERFFVYYEDLDLSRRVLQSGHSIQYLASPAVFHRRAGTTQGATAKSLSYLFEGRLLFAEKHFGLWGVTFVKVGLYCVEPIRRLMQSSLSRSGATRKETIEALSRLRAIRAGDSIDRS